MANQDRNLILILISLFIPPLAVALKKGLGIQFLLNLLLCLFFFFPAIVHAVWVIMSDE
jgi:uncharacterized membrane protein YqaE (UPF0057 family)